MKTFNRFNIFFVIFILFHSIGYSYIDPGSLSAIWQFLAAILLGLATTYVYVKTKIGSFINRFFKSNSKKDNSDETGEDENNK